jgi:hypothetical protein
MNKVSKSVGAVIVRMDNNAPLNIAINERNYVIYLSYILGSLKGGLIGKYKKVFRTDFLNGEVYKQMELVVDGEAKTAYENFIKLKNEKQLHNCFEKIESRDYVNVRPDFVIHSDHKKEYEYWGQKLIVEAKTTKKIDEIDFCWDLLKLNVYINEFCFQNAIYMLVNTTKDEIEKMLKFYNEKINYYAHDINKLWFYIQKWDGRKLLPTTIYQIDVKKDNSNGSIVIGNTVYV